LSCLQKTGKGGEQGELPAESVGCALSFDVRLRSLSQQFAERPGNVRRKPGLALYGLWICPSWSIAA
jgi:hypothetical protein